VAKRNPLPLLVASAKRSVWRMNDHAGEADKAFQVVRKSILLANDYTCLYCGHRSEKYQEVHHRNDDHSNNATENLDTSCPLCHQVFHLGLAGMLDGADIIYAPEFAQEEINQLALITWLIDDDNRAVFRDANESIAFDKLSSKAKSISALMEGRRGTVLLRLKKLLKVNSSFPEERLEDIKMTHVSPLLISNVLMSLDDKTNAQRQSLLGGLRIWPKPIRFRKQIEHWRAETSAVLPVPVWFNILPEESVIQIVTTCKARLDDLMVQADSGEPE